MIKKVNPPASWWRRTGLKSRNLYRRLTFDAGKSVYGGKWMDGKYSQYPSKWVMIAGIKKEHRQGAPKEGYSYAQAKAGNMLKRQTNTSVKPIVSGDLYLDLNKTKINVKKNGVEFGFSARGHIVKGLRERFKEKGTLTSKDKPMPTKVSKFVAKKYNEYLKKNSKNTTRHHRKK